MPFVRLAEFEIDPDQLGPYTAAVRDAVEYAIAVEPGLIAIYAVADENNPSKLTFFEIYIDEAAHRSHIQSAHFARYRTSTDHMVLSRAFFSTIPLLVCTK